MNLKLLTLLLYLFPLSTSAQTKVKVYTTKGLVTQNGKSLKKGELVIGKKTLIKTQKNSLVVFKLMVGPFAHTIKLLEDTELTLSPDLKENQLKAQMSSGTGFFQTLKSKLKALGPVPKQKLVLKVKNVAMGVRGTYFFVSQPIQEDKAAWMCVKKGEVMVSSKVGKNIPVKAGQGIKIKSGNVTAPEDYHWTKNLNWNLDDQSGDLENQYPLETIFKKDKANY